MLPVLIVLFAYLALTPIEVRLDGPAGRGRRANLAMILPVSLAAAATDLALIGIADRAADHHVGLLPALGAPPAVAVVVALLGLDLAAYLGHRWRHRSPVLWRIHRAHHTDPDVDVTTTLRNHPLDVAFLGVVSTAAAVALGAPAMAVAVSAVLSATWGVLSHARVRLPRRLERALATVVQTPGTHRVHHAPERPLTDTNFGLVLTVWDRLFGTFAPPDPSQVTGLDTADLDRRQSVRAMLADPWRPAVALPDGPTGRSTTVAAAEVGVAAGSPER